MRCEVRSGVEWIGEGKGKGKGEGKGKVKKEGK